MTTMHVAAGVFLGMCAFKLFAVGLDLWIRPVDVDELRIYWPDMDAKLKKNPVGFWIGFVMERFKNIA